jgi:phosphohistidine phosphatase SixA
VTEHLGAGASVSRQISWLKELRPAPGGVLLVGHEPNFSELTSHLLTGARSLSLHFRKAGLCKVSAERPGAGGATLEWFLTPKQMELMRSKKV